MAKKNLTCVHPPVYSREVSGLKTALKVVKRIMEEEEEFEVRCDDSLSHTYTITINADDPANADLLDDIVENL